MITRHKLAAIALAGTCLAPLAALGQTAPSETKYEGVLFTGDIGIGVGGVFGNNTGEAGRYSGYNVPGFDATGEFHLHGGDAWDSGGTRYYELDGDRLTLQTGNQLGALGGRDTNWLNSVNNTFANDGSLQINVGDQGTWGLSIHFNSITYTGDGIDSIYTTRGSQAFLNPGLLPFGGSTGAGPGPITGFTVPTLNATGAEQGVQTGTRRDIFGLEGHYEWGDWTFTGAFRHEHKEGTLEQALFGTWGGMAFAKPIDFDTNRYDAIAEYTNRLWQGVFQYTFSQFTDNFDFIALPYPVSGTGLPFQRQAAFAQPPSNEAHYLTVELGSSQLIPATRVNLNLRVGLEKQDDGFPPNTADPIPSQIPGVSGVNAALQGTTAGSLDAIAKIYQLKLSADSHPFANAEGRIYYGLDGRDVSINQFKVTTGATGGGAADASLIGTQFAVPQNWFKQNAGGEFSYRFLQAPDSKLTVGYRFDSVGRSNAQVGHSYTNSADAAILTQFSDQVDGKISFEYADRSGVLSYLTPWLNLDGSINSATYSGAYYQAPMTSEAVKLRADYTPMPMLTGGFYAEFKNEDFHYPAATAANGVTAANPASFTGQGYGLKSDYALSLGPDINIRPTATTNVHLYYTYELLYFNNLGNGACQTLPLSAACTGSVGFFQNKYTSGTQTMGVNAEWKVNDKLKLKADYTFSYGSVMFGQFDGVFVPPALVTQSFQNVSNYPDIHSLMHNLSPPRSIS